MARGLSSRPGESGSGGEAFCLAVSLPSAFSQCKTRREPRRHCTGAVADACFGSKTCLQSSQACPATEYGTRSALCAGGRRPRKQTHNT